ncbi:helix-turn-helix domain-containing protein [Tengunoibacter tsumagoiensis]|uniref:AraC family transcriptional regulator n=1 Tax=Tengunoibacter tsumagoiensis TaxID=2014871 RepID=A0A402A9N8_9CHLR|nr:helix-turn-helix domain-containing protein [Tengunoibacter tsumagoiensis]GCE15894.1 AraC family transcriptional regulator [Tengunoibacter tsumagoiensis]
MFSLNDEFVENQIMGLAGEWRPATIMPRPHRHNEIELNVVETGSITYLFGGSRISIRPNHLAIFWGATPHQVVHIEPDSHFHWITIPFSLFMQCHLPDTLLQQIIGGKFLQYVLEELCQEICIRLHQWHHDMKAQTPEHNKIILLELEASLRRILLSVPHPSSEQDQHHGTASTTLNKVEEIAAFIAESYTQPLKVEQIASHVHLHPNYAMSLFRKHVGISITEYINQYRVAHAQRLLLTSDANVSEIALSAGFGSVSRFYSVFKEAYGQDPTDFRKGFSLSTNKK